MSLYTHWVCFDCRKSFHDLPREACERLCPECGAVTWDMGVYFEPPRRQARRAWAVMRLIAESGYRFQTEGRKALIDRYFLGHGRPGVEAVRRRILAHEEALQEYRAKTRLKVHKEERARRRRRP